MDLEAIVVGAVPPRLVEPMTRALTQLGNGIATGTHRKALQGALNVEQAGLDLLLQFSPIVEIDIDRFLLWTRRIIVDVQSEYADGLKGDASTLEWIRDHIASSLDKTDVTSIDKLLKDLRGIVNDEDFGAAKMKARELEAIVENAATRPLVC